MPIGYSQLPALLPVPGIRLAAVAAGIRYQGRNDLVVMELAQGGHAAAVFTRNAFCAAPVVVAREHLQHAMPRYLLVNSGNANAGTGADGLADARRSCLALAQLAGCEAQQVMPFSTGVIGQRLSVDRLQAALPAALASLDGNGWAEAAKAIKTTDTVAKGISSRIQIDGRTVTVTGIAKGAGMIRPDMATMLAYIGTDADVDPAALQHVLETAVQRSFNRITVDGDTSTNDACVLVATGACGNSAITAAHPDYTVFCETISATCEHLAQLIVRDAEGATKFVTVEVSGGGSSAECLQVAYTVAHSPLVKTALFASDPNWGRILAAVGRAGLVNLDVDSVSIFLDDVCIVRDGAAAADYAEADGQRVMDQEEILIDIRLGRGDAHERVWTSDLSHEYVRINAEYRS
jgi:glutamate N-acetyltransferase / amino-acid N-acetyltransferase